MGKLTLAIIIKLTLKEITSAVGILLNVCSCEIKSRKLPSIRQIHRKKPIGSVFAQFGRVKSIDPAQQNDDTKDSIRDALSKTTLLGNIVQITRILLIDSFRICRVCSVSYSCQVFLDFVVSYKCACHPIPGPPQQAIVRF